MSRLLYNLYCVGGDVKHCSLTHSSVRVGMISVGSLKTKVKVHRGLGPRHLVDPADFCLQVQVVLSNLPVTDGSGRRDADSKTVVAANSVSSQDAMTTLMIFKSKMITFTHLFLHLFTT